jgi:hypothetical protein
VRAARVLRNVVSTAALAGLAASFVRCGDQPKANCITFVAGWSFRLIPQGMPVESAPGACLNFGPAGFNADSEAGVLSYYQKDDKGQPDYNKGSVAIQTQEIATLVANVVQYIPTFDPNSLVLYSYGAYRDEVPDDQDICTAPTLTPTHIVLPALPPVMDDPATMDVDETFPGQDAQDITLTWSNMRVYVTAASYGTQLQVALQDTRLTPTGDSCTFNYLAIGLAPAAPCTLLDTNGDAILDASGNPQPDDTACDPQPNVAANRPLGSGLSPNTDYKCDPVTFFCTIKEDTVPGLR